MTATWSKNPKFRTGAKRTPAHKIAEAIASGRLKIHKAGQRRDGTLTGPTPTQFAMVPKQMSMWNNDVDGCCVTSEEAFAVAAYSTLCGTEYFIQDQTVLNFCNQFGVLNGADLLSVIQDMEQTGFLQGSDVITDGGSSTVDYTNEPVLQSAISQGPVKIGIDANALPSDAGNNNGWAGFGGSPGQFGNEDHCVSLTGFGPTAWLAQQLGVSVPAGAPANCYLLFTWSTIGFVDFAWIQSTTGEAYLRSPTTIINGKPLVPPGPGPTPPGPTPRTFTPPYYLWVGGSQWTWLSFSDIPSAMAMAQNVVGVVNAEVDVKDSTGALVQAVLPTPGPTPPGPTPPGPSVTISVPQAGTYALINQVTAASLSTLGKSLDDVVAAALNFENALKGRW